MCTFLILINETPRALFMQIKQSTTIKLHFLFAETPSMNLTLE